MAISKLILNGEVQMDVTSDTVAAGSLLSGKTATKNDGTKVTGTIASKSSSDLTVSGTTVTAPAGYYANAASKAVATTTHPNPSASITSSTGVVTASHTQGTGYVTGGTTTGTLNLTTQAGKTVTPTESVQTAVASYRWTTGNVNVAAISSTYVGTGVAKKSSADLTTSGSTVTAPAGYYSTAATKSIGAGSAFPPAVTITKAPTIGVNTSGVVTASYNGSSSITPTITSGYVSQGTAGTISTTGTSTYQLTSKAAATYYPSTADQTIASQRWLVGNQTIKSVTTSNLTAENIAEGVVVEVGDSSNASRITQVTGTHKSGGYICTLTNSGNGYINIKYNDIYYKNENDNFSFNQGDTIQFNCGYGDTNYIRVNGKIKASAANQATARYDLVAPGCSITVSFTISMHGASSIDISIPEIDITENGQHEVGGYGYANVDVKPTYTATIIRNGSNGSNYKCYVTYNGIVYRLKDETFEFHGGDTVTFSLYNNRAAAVVVVDNTKIYTFSTTTTSTTYNYTLPNHDIDIQLNNGGYIDPYGFGVYVVSPTIEISENGTYDVVDYAKANVDVTSPYYSTYEKITYNLSTIDNTDSDYLSFIGVIHSNAFQGREFAAGIHNFANVSIIHPYGMAGPRQFWAVPDSSIIFSFPKVTTISSYAFQERKIFHEIYCEKCTTIGSTAFMSCYSLKTISFPSCTFIGMNAFRDCYSLVSAIFPQCTQISQYAFSNCSALTTASFAKCTNMGPYTFYGCSKLINISFPSCQRISLYAFGQCSSLASAIFPSCESINTSAFIGCRNLSIASFPLCIGINDSAFLNCTGLQTISFPECNTIGYSAFYNCSALTSVFLPKCYSIGQYAFALCSALSLVTISATTNPLSIGTYAFVSCYSLKEVHLSNCSLIGFSAFSRCYNLISLYLTSISSVPTLSAGVFYSSPIGGYSTSAGRYGSVFVPASLYNSFLTAVYWSDISSRIVSV